jgi:glycosyltransferase involved in cell wall biosynthesis
MWLFSNMKKTVFLNGRFLTRPLTGVQRTAFEMVCAIDRLIEKKQVEVDDVSLVLIYSGEIINPIELKHIKLLQRGKFTGNVWEQLELPLYTWGSLLISMCSISTLFKAKQILIVHDASFLVNKSFFSFAFRTWYKFAIPFISFICRQIVTVSYFSRSELIKHGGINPKKLTVIYNSADHILRFGEPSETFTQKINALKPYCLTVSSLGANKNFPGLSKAIAKIDFSNYHMLIAGGEIGTLKYAPPGSEVNYLGYVSNDELKYLYTNASLFIFPSFYEGFGIPPLEAMICQCPVIASNTSSIPEVLADACDYFDPSDSEGMAQAIATLINDKARLNELKIKGYQRALNYDWEKSGLQLYKLIQKFY